MASLPDKPPLLFVHGLWSTPAVWSGLRGHFDALGYPTLAPAMPLHDAEPGAPPDPRLGTMGIGDSVEAVLSAASALPQPPVIVGHSAGAVVAQLAAARLPARALVLLSPAGTAATARLSWGAFKAVSSVLLERQWWKRPVLIDRAKAREAIFNGVPAGIAEAELDSMVQESGRVLAQLAFPWADKAKAVSVDYARLTAPALVVVGEADRLTPVSVARATARALRDVEYREVAGAGHWLFHPPVAEEVAGVIEGFLARV